MSWDDLEGRKKKIKNLLFIFILLARKFCGGLEYRLADFIFI